MFVRYYVELERPFEDIEGALLRDPESWIPRLAHRAEGRGERLLTQVGFGDALRMQKTVAIELGEPIRIGTKTILPIVWRPANMEALFPSLEGDLEVAPIGLSTCQVSMTARYVPPFGLLGKAADRALLHRVAEATVKDFVDAAAALLQDELATGAAG